MERRKLDVAGLARCGNTSYERDVRDCEGEEISRSLFPSNMRESEPVKAGIKEIGMVVIAIKVFHFQQSTSPGFWERTRVIRKQRRGNFSCAAESELYEEGCWKQSILHIENGPSSYTIHSPSLRVRPYSFLLVPSFSTQHEAFDIVGS